MRPSRTLLNWSHFARWIEKAWLPLAASSNWLVPSWPRECQLNGLNNLLVCQKGKCCCQDGL